MAEKKENYNKSTNNSMVQILSFGVITGQAGNDWTKVAIFSSSVAWVTGDTEA